MLNISLSCPGLSYHYHPCKTRSWNLNPASYAICQGSWMMKGQREIYYRRRRKGHHRMAARRGKQEEKKVRSLFCFWWGSWVSSVNPLNTHTLMSPESQDITARTPESDLGKKAGFNFSTNRSWRWVNGRYDKYVTHNEVCNLLESFGKLSSW